MQVALAAEPVASATLQTAGFLIAEGDSWLAYPLHDELKLPEDNDRYNVESAAHRGRSTCSGDPNDKIVEEYYSTGYS